MPLERRNEPQMLRQFSKMYPSYNLNPLLRRRHQQLVEAQAFFLSFRRTVSEHSCEEIYSTTQWPHRQLKVAVLERNPVANHKQAPSLGTNAKQAGNKSYRGVKCKISHATV